MRVCKHLMLCALVLVATALPAPSSAKSVPWYIKVNDLKHLERANRYAIRDRWFPATEAAQKASDEDIRALFAWRRHLYGGDDASFVQITSFIKEYPNWPHHERLERRAELKLSPRTDDELVLGWFTLKTYDDGRTLYKEPMTGRGKYVLAEARLRHPELDARPNEVTKMIRESWVEGNFGAKEAENFLKRHASHLRTKDHQKRIERLLWDGHARDAALLLPKIKGAQYAVFRARVALQTRKRGVDALLKKVPKHFQRDEGLLYDRAKWRRKAGNHRGVIQILQMLPKHVDHPHKWWPLKRRYIPELLSQKKYQEAYDLAHAHGFTQHEVSQLADAEWLSGWIALRYLQDPRAAYKHFYILHRNAAMPISLGRAAYWAARASEMNGNDDIARRWYKVASSYGTSFYGQLAAQKQDKSLVTLRTSPEVTTADKRAFQANRLAKIAYLLHKVDNHFLAKKFLQQAIDNAKTPGEQYLIAQLGVTLKRPDYTITAAKKSTARLAIFPDMLYPVLDNIKDVRGNRITEPEKALIFSIIRQESIFNPDAKSHAGARGLMQLMPSTARQVAKKHKLKYRQKWLTSDPTYNLTLGSHYLNTLLKEFDGSYILAIASYNAGPNNVKKWIKRFGDPRTFKKAEKVIDWMELIPFPETQNYVQRVIENLQLYRHILGNGSAMTVRVEEDIMR